MILTIYSSKGSAGKTPIATNIVLDRGYAVGTNEPFHLYNDFEAIPEDRVLYVEMDEAFPRIPANIDIVFDLAGSMSRTADSIVSAIEQSNLVIVPIFDQVYSLSGGLGTIGEVMRLNTNILVVATKLKRTHRENRRTAWEDTTAFQNIKRQACVC